MGGKNTWPCYDGGIVQEICVYLLPAGLPYWIAKDVKLCYNRQHIFVVVLFPKVCYFL